MQNIAYLYIWFIYSIGFAAPATTDQSRIPQRSLTINSEVADAALWDGVWVRSWQGSHHSCVTCLQYIWHVPSNPTLHRYLYRRYAVKIYIGLITFHYFHCWACDMWTRSAFYNKLCGPSLLYVLYLTCRLAGGCGGVLHYRSFQRSWHSGCFCSPAICSMRTGLLSIDLPSLMWLYWVQNWGICSMSGNRMDR